MNALAQDGLQSNLDRIAYDKNKVFFFLAHQLNLGKSSTHALSSYDTLHIGADNIGLVYPFCVA